MIIAGALVASPFTLAYFQTMVLGGEYCVFPPYWLEVFGPAAALAVLGLGALVWRYASRARNGEFTGTLVSWSALAVAIGVLGYVTNFPIVLSDRSLLLLPIPVISSIGALWIVDRVPAIRRFSQIKLLAILAVVITILTVPVVFLYTAPHFMYFAQHSPSLVTCATS
jgi:ABC-type Na+ efflux pump permease subunit